MTTGTRPRALVVEDEILVAMMLEDTLSELGYTVVGPVHRLGDALAAAESEAVDVAVLDLNLDGSSSIPVADLLAARGVPFLFATGYGEAGLDGAHPEAPVVRKPFAARDVALALSRMRR